MASEVEWLHAPFDWPMSSFACHPFQRCLVEVLAFFS